MAIEFRKISVPAALVTALALAGCSSSGNSNPLVPTKAALGTVVVGSNNFAESILLSDIYGEALRAKGFTVDYKPNIGTRETTFGIMKTGALTVMPEYNGALLAYLDPKAVPTSEAATDAAVTAKLPSELALLQPSSAQDKDSLTVNAATAAQYGLTADSTIADLAKDAPQLVIGGAPEFQTRQQGLVGLKSVYGLNFKSFKALDPGGPLSEAALQKNDVQVADIFTTDPTIAQDKFVTLQDPKDLFGFQNVVPLVYKTTLSPTGVSTLNEVSAKLDTATLLSLDAQVQNDSKDPLTVAQSWLKSVDLG